MSRKKMTARTTAVVRLIERRAPVAARGVTELYALRDALHHLARTMGLRVELNPCSDPELADYLGISAIAVVEGGIAGAAAGALIGSLLRAASAGAAVGTLVGLVVGSSVGTRAVSRGWRLRTAWSVDGEAIALLEPWK